MRSVAVIYEQRATFISNVQLFQQIKESLLFFDV